MGARGRSDRACKRGRILDVEDIMAFNEQNEADRARMLQEKVTAEAIGEAGADQPSQPN
jgi:hypothetical protein